MIRNRFINRLLTANLVYDNHSRDYRRLLFLSTLLVLTVIVLGFFAALNYLKHANYVVSALDFFAMLNALFTLLYLHRYKNLERAIFLATANFFIFLLAFAYVNQNQNFGLIWTTFFPLFTIVLNGTRRGVVYVGIYYLVLFFIAYGGVDLWLNDEWGLVSLLRFIAASLILSSTILFMEYSQEFSEERLERVRQKEAKMMEELKRLSIVDPLTQLYNRRHLSNIFNRQFQSARRHKMYFALFILDIDFFKQYNDTYGHQKGDDALCAVAQALKDSMRRSDDYVFRFGGEEFSGICMSEERAKLEAQITFLVDAVSALKIEHKNSKASAYLSASIGAKVINDFEGRSFDQLLKEADDALYRAKEEGRNRIVFA